MITQRKNSLLLLPQTFSYGDLFFYQCNRHRRIQLEPQTPWRNRQTDRCRWTSCRISWAGRRWRSWWGWSWWGQWWRQVLLWLELLLCWARRRPRTWPLWDYWGCKPSKYNFVNSWQRKQQVLMAFFFLITNAAQKLENSINIFLKYYGF